MSADALHGKDRTGAAEGAAAGDREQDAIVAAAHGEDSCRDPGTLMYKSGLVPRIIPTMGLIGAPLLIAANTATLFGHNEQTSAISFLATLPVAAWELSVGTWMLVKGFKPAPITAGLTKVD